jgi:hypothetical protein
VFCSKWLADPLISFGPKFVVTAFEGLVQIHQGTRNYILKNKNFDVKNFQDFVFKYSNEQ